jgi:hypothetical protein
LKNNLILIFLFSISFAFSQEDKAILKNGAIIKGRIVSLAKDRVFIQLSDSSKQTKSFLKNEIALLEKYDGKIYIFSEKINLKDSSTYTFKKNNFSMQPFGIFLGRATLNYERLLHDGKIGISFPLIVTFDPVGVIYKPVVDSTRPTSNVHQQGFNYITGIDLNFYETKGKWNGFFLGPRIRFGVDMLLRNIEAYSIQTQIGYIGKSYNGSSFHSLSIGFGFVRILSSPAGNLISPKETFGWGSVNYKIGFGW